MAKINVLVVPSDLRGGVGFFRSIQPHLKLQNMFPDDFNVTFNADPDYTNLEYFEQFNIIHIHKGLVKEAFIDAFHNMLKHVQEMGIVTVMDIDDYWDLGMRHPQYIAQRTKHYDKQIMDNLRLFDYVTTTTPAFAEHIAKFNKNVVIMPNAIDPDDPSFQTHKTQSDKIRVGLVMGSSHKYDIELLRGMTNSLPYDVMEKIQLVLCGFDTEGQRRTYDSEGNVTKVEKIKPEEGVWNAFESVITDNWKICSPEYKQFLGLFVPNAEYPNIENEHYRRCWTKDMSHYFSHYDNVDILLAPLDVSEFNRVKSQLKCIECCFSNTAIIASDFGPYQIDLVNAIERGGVINPKGNAILVDESKNHKDWSKSITKLVRNPELLEMIRTNLHNDLKDKYNLAKVTTDRAEFYKKITNKE